MLKTLLLILAVFSFGTTSALAHASLESSEPAANAVVGSPLSQVELLFTEGVEVAFSSFKVYRIDAEVDLASDNAAMRLNALAAVLVSDYNGQQTDGDGKVEANVGTAPNDKALVNISFDEPLEPGHYVVMWRVLSVDTHVIDGHVIFSVTE